MAESNELTGMNQQGSEEYYENPCEPCKRENQHVEGIGYCQDCMEYLCDTCLKCHTKLLISRDHILLDSMSMSSTKKAPPPLPPRLKQGDSTTNKKETGKSLTRMCPIHAQELTKFFCNGHGTLACSVCLSLDHRNCEDVSYIPDEAVNVEKSEEFKEVFNSLKMMQATIKFENNRAEYNDKRSNEIHDKARADIQEFRESIKQHIDRLCEDAVNELSELHKNDNKQMTNWFKIFNRFSLDIDKATRLLDETLNKGNNSHLFIQVKLLKEDLPGMQSVLKSIRQNNSIMPYTFEGNSDIFDQLSNAKSIGSFRKRKEEKYATAKPLPDINVKSERDTHDCNINAAIILKNGNLVISDHLNKSIKLIDPNQNMISAELVMESEPFGLTVINETQLAVTMPNVDKIQLVGFADAGLSKGKTLNLTMTCADIECKDETLIVSCQEPGCLKILDLEWRVLQTIDNDQFGCPLLQMPRSIALSADKSVVYVTEWEKETVNVISLEGEKIAVFDSEDFKKPLGMKCDTSGVLYVSYGDVHSVILLTPSGEHIHTLLGKEDGLLRPWAMALDTNNAKLYVGSASTRVENRNKMRVFQLLYD